MVPAGNSHMLLKLTFFKAKVVFGPGDPTATTNGAAA